MRVYFDATPSGLPQLKENYHAIASMITKLGHQHTNDFITSFDPHFYATPINERANHYQMIKRRLDQSDVIVAETTISSTSLGMCIEYGLLQGKPLIILKTKQRDDIFVEGAGETESKILIIEYSLEKIESQLRDAFDYIKDWMETRFTLIIDQKVKRHLDTIASNGQSRSEYIRGLIEKDMCKR